MGLARNVQRRSNMSFTKPGQSLLKNFRSSSNCGICRTQASISRSFAAASWRPTVFKAQQARQAVRYASSATPSTPYAPQNESDMSEKEYQYASDITMESLHESLEELVEGDDVGALGGEVEYSAGVLTLVMGSHGTYVINKQPPNKQLWLSSPKSGPKRFNFNPSTGTWLYGRDNISLGGLLNEELGEILGREGETLVDDGHEIM